MAQRWPPPKPKCPQEEFDEAVQTNIDTFDMTAEEAVKSAIEEFTVQGYDLSGVVKKAGGGNTESHPLTLAAAELEACGDDPAKIAGALDSLHQSLSAEGADAVETAAVALKARAVKPMLLACAVLSSAATPADGAAPDSVAGQRDSLLLSLQLAVKLMGLSLENRDVFDQVDGGALVAKMMEQHSADAEVLCAVAAVAEMAALKVEQNKMSLMEAQFGLTALKLLRSTAAELASDPGSPDLLLLVRTLCSALGLLVSADDDRPPGSAAFKNARLLAKEGGAAQVLLETLKQAASDADTCCSTLMAVQKFSANDEICKEFAEGGGVLVALQALHTWNRRADVVKAALWALRQLSNSDTVKKMLAENNCIEEILSIVSIHGKADDVLEPALGLLTNMMLRLPEVATKAAEVGAMEGVLEVMASRPGSGPVLRQGCMAIRNMSVRNPELRQPLLDRGAEAIVRQARSQHPKTCGDVGAAALRDLGLDNYNDLEGLPKPAEKAAFSTSQNLSEGFQGIER